MAVDTSSFEQLRLVAEYAPPHEAEQHAGWLTDLVGDVAAEVQGDVGARLPQIAEEAFGRLGRGLGARRVVLHRVDAIRGRVTVSHEWAEPGLVPLHSTDLSITLDELPWRVQTAAPGDVLIDNGGSAANLFGAATVVIVPLMGERGVSALLLLHFFDEDQLTDLQCAPLLRALGLLIWNAERTTELLDRAAFDEVTGLANRKLLLMTLGRTLARLGRGTTTGVAVVACQLNGGPDAGSAEENLALVGRCLDRNTRESDLVALFDRRSLVVLCEDVAGPAEAQSEARRLRDLVVGAVREASDDQSRERAVSGVLPASWTASFGVAHAASRVPPGVLLRQADSAAYMAAASGEPVRLAED
jgi:GGDEF domain-containing protein